MFLDKTTNWLTIAPMNSSVPEIRPLTSFTNSGQSLSGPGLLTSALKPSYDWPQPTTWQVPSLRPLLRSFWNSVSGLLITLKKTQPGLVTSFPCWWGLQLEAMAGASKVGHDFPTPHPVSTLTLAVAEPQPNYSFCLVAPTLWAPGTHFPPLVPSTLGW